MNIHPNGQKVKSRLVEAIDRLTAEVEEKVIHWRREFHQNPELPNREFQTSRTVAAHLKSLGLEVSSNIAKTGVIGILRGRSEYPVVALRADMDALPVTELADVPFKSKIEGVMHACGHDCHTAILMGAAEVLSKLRDQIQGTVKFLFQPAEEGPPEGEEGGAPLMIQEGALESPAPDAIFGLHVGAFPSGKIGYRSGAAMASADLFEIVVKGSQTHGAMPWLGVDPIVVASQIILGLQTIVSRQVDLTRSPAVITVGKIKGGNRFNIIPDRVEMAGAIRVLDDRVRKNLLEKFQTTVHSIAASAGAEAEISFNPWRYALTYNDPVLTRRMESTFLNVVGEEGIIEFPLLTGSEDFGFYQEKIPGLFFFLGVAPPDIGKAPPSHSPYFVADDGALGTGVRLMSNLAADFLNR